MNIGVTGLGYGDEGKGVVVNWLSKQYGIDSVKRTGGGCQCGHTVIEGDRKHIFKHYASNGLLSGNTLWSKKCPIFPTIWEKEYDLIGNIAGNFYFHPESLITTPYDVAYNRIVSQKGNSVGMGIMPTKKRSEYIKVYLKDINYPTILSTKLDLVNKFYKDRYFSQDLNYYNTVVDSLGSIDSFIESMKHMLYISHESNLKKRDKILEGNQGIMLSSEYGYYPYMTYDSCIGSIAKGDDDVNYLVTRIYQTRHGNGPLKYETKINLFNNEEETNHNNDYQGDFRVGILNLDEIIYATNCAKKHMKRKPNLVVTCVDQFINPIAYRTHNNNLKTVEGVDQILGYIKNYYDKIYICRSAKGDIEKWK